MSALNQQTLDDDMLGDAPKSSGDEPREVDQIRLYQTLVKANFDLIRLADQKSQYMLRVAMTLFGAAFIGVPPSVVALRNYTTGGGWHHMVLFVTVILLYIIFSICLLTAITKLIHVVRPRSVPPNVKTSIFLFAHVAATELDDFCQQVREMTYDQTLDELLMHIHQSSRIADRKFKDLERALAWMFGGGLIGVAFALILLVSVGWMKGA